MKAPKKRGAATRPRGPGPRLRQWLVVLALSAVTLLAYSNSFGAGFTFDNKGLLLQDPRIREATSQNIGLILHKTYWWPYGESGLYRPITTLTYLFNFSILGNGDRPAGWNSTASAWSPWKRSVPSSSTPTVRTASPAVSSSSTPSPTRPWARA